MGSFNLSCDSVSGQCFCRPGVQGLKCDQCKPLFYGFSDEGCKKCDCDPFGTQFNDLQCDDFGKCNCRENFAGLKCNKCDENRYNFTSGCLKCEECYNLVQDQVGLLRDKIKLIQVNLNKIIASGNPSAGPNSQNQVLHDKLKSLKLYIDNLHDELYASRSLKSTYKDSVSHLHNELKRISETIKNTDQSFEQFNSIYRQAERLYNEADNSVDKVRKQLNFISIKNSEQSSRLDAIIKGRLDYEQNDKLQNLAKQSRETAEKQKTTAQTMSDELRSNVEEARKAFKDLQDILSKFEGLEDNKRTDQLSFNYDELKNRANTLASEALEQKELLDESVKGANAFIQKLKDFKIPEDNLNRVEAESEKNKELVEEISTKSSSIKKDIDELKNKFEKFSNVDSLNSIGSAQTQLNSAKIKQKVGFFIFIKLIIKKFTNSSSIIFKISQIIIKK